LRVSVLGSSPQEKLPLKREMLSPSLSLTLCMQDSWLSECWPQIPLDNTPPPIAHPTETTSNSPLLFLQQVPLLAKSVCWCLPCFWPFELDSRNVGLGYSQEVWPHFGVCSRLLDLEVHEIYFVLKINTWNDISQNFLVFSTSGKLYAQNTLMIMTDFVLTSCSC